MATATPPTPGETIATPDPAPPKVAPAPEPPPGPTGLAARVQAFREKHAKAEIVVFFSIGFVFDLLTLDRIDSWLTLVQQAIYLSILAGMLLLEQRHALGLFAPKGVLGKAWRFHEDAMHFFFGSLLSSYTLFYFKSASGFQAVAFMLALVALLVINELPRFRKLGPLMRFALFSLCLSSYLAYVIPVLVGHVNWWLFTIAIVMASAVTVGIYKRIEKWGAQNPNVVAPNSASFQAISANVRGRRLLYVSLAVQVVFLTLYFVRALPPVPLSLTYLGVFHNVSVIEEPIEVAPPKKAAKPDAPPAKVPTKKAYLLEHNRPLWKFWQKGDQSFSARPGDKAWVFMRVFAPRGYKDPIFVKWSYDDPKHGWRSGGNRTRLHIYYAGGRDDGSATFAYHSDPKPGDWKAEVQTEDGRDIGEIHFTVEADPGTEPRVFTVEKR